ncbi:rootletin-like isoform X1 [Anguilla anguilla]|uniref:rootletin-like isoform X1 n=2 Tax=Anguilla anguilla TaxID=7936 RepID=UPI0015AEE948|nr:rootletin-like isoform X1 [Anguilla anguilla]XP_035254539.1 rootletin-like isoform X1 [Anguilla anguilla]
MMSSKDNACRKFQANIFNKSKCQNCFKPRESHLLNAEDLSQAKPIYGGWLLLAPEGTNFDNPGHRSRKWQRRFFILYEHGLLRYALDEMPSTLPQGTINMSRCSAVLDAEPQTGHSHALCIRTPDTQHFIRAESKEAIHGWQESLEGFIRTNKHNQKKKKRKDVPQETGRAKGTVMISNGGEAGGTQPRDAPCSRPAGWQEQRGRTAVPCSHSAPSLHQPECGPLLQSSSSSGSLRDHSKQGSLNGSRKERAESGYFSLEKPKPDSQPPQRPRHLPLSSPSGPEGPHRYPSSDPDPLTSPLPPDSLRSNGTSTFSASLTSLDSDLSPATPKSPTAPTIVTTPPSCEDEEEEDEGRVWGGGCGGERAGRGGRRPPVSYASLADVPKAKRLTQRLALSAHRKRLEQRARSPGREEVARLFGLERRRPQVIEKFEMLEGDGVEHVETSCASSSSGPPSSSCSSNSASRQGRIERRHVAKNQMMSLDASTERSMPDVSRSSLFSSRRAKSLDRKAPESSVTPDLLNFKKGWMTKPHEDGTWRKHWFVLTDQSLRFFRDSIAEEAADLDGEIDLSTCYDVTEFPVPRNYGFQVHTKEGPFTLCAMTSGIRRSWMQALRQSARPAAAPDVTRTLPGEKADVGAALGFCPPPLPEVRPGAESPATGGTVPSGSGCGSEPRKRIWNRRHGGCRNALDWAEIYPGLAQENCTAPPGGHPKGSTDAVDGGSTASPDSSSSCPAFPGSSLPVAEEAREGERGRRRSEGRPCFQVASAPTTPAFTRPIAAPASRVGGDGQEVGQLPGDVPDVRVEIEQQWLQVETTPLREEKQIPISGALPSDPPPERPPLQTAPLGSQLEQVQLELSRLQEHNGLLQEQLREGQSRGRSDREGYVLQSGFPLCSSGCADSCRQLNRLKQDQQLQPEGRQQDPSAQQAQVLEPTVSEAEIQALRAQLTDTAAELLARERAVSEALGETALERERFQDQREEWAHSERTLRVQLRDTEDRLRDVEACLLEKSQALRDLERQQALQQDYGKEVQNLQESLSEVTARLVAAQETQALKEESLETSRDLPHESWDKERQCLMERLAEVEARRHELEDQLRTAELQGERGDLVHRLEEQLATKTDAIQDLTEMTRRLTDEKDQLTCRCQELLNQITEADNEVSKLQSRLAVEETDYCSLDRSYHKLYEEFQRISQVLWEKEEEIQEVKEIYERQAEMKEKDLNEALVKLAALECRLEETQLKLQAKEEAVCRVSQGSMEPCAAERDLGGELTAAENRIAELEQELSSMRLAYTALQRDCSTVQGDPYVQESSSKQDKLTDAIHPEDIGKINNPSLIDHDPSEENGSSDTLLESVASAGGAMDTEKFIGIINTLENKLYSSEEKLKDITLKLEEQEGLKTEAVKEQRTQWAELEAELCLTLSECMSRECRLYAQLQDDLDERRTFGKEADCRVSAENGACAKALACLELSREKVQSILRGRQEGCAETQSHTLSEIEAELCNATLHIRRGGNGLEEQKLDHQGTRNLGMKENKVSGLDRIELSAHMLEFEALVLKKMALSVRNPISDLLQSLREIHQEAENLKRGNESYVAIIYADVVARKLMVECEFWAEVDKLEVQTEEPEDWLQSVRDSAEENSDVTSSNCVQTDLANSIQNLKSFYDEKFRKLQSELLEAHANLKRREVALKEVVSASKRAGFGRLGQGLSDEIDRSQGTTLAYISPPELAPYLEQITMEEARDLAEEIVSQHLQRDVLICHVEAVDSPRVGQERLATELQLQAEVLQRLSRELEATYETEMGSVRPCLINVLHNKHYKPAGNVASSTLSMQETTIPFVACKPSMGQERDMKQCNGARQSTGGPCQEYDPSIGAAHEGCITSLQEECQSLTQALAGLREENHALRQEVSHYAGELSQRREQTERMEERFQAEAEELKALYEMEIGEAEQRMTANELSLMEKMADCQQKLEVLLLDIEGMEDRHEEHVRKLEAQSQGRMEELHWAHREEVERMQSQHTQSLRTLLDALDRLQAKHPEDSPLPELAVPPLDQAMLPHDQAPSHHDQAPSPHDQVPSPHDQAPSPHDQAPPLHDQAPPTEGQAGETGTVELDSTTVLRQRIQELEMQVNSMQDQLGNKTPGEDVSSLKEKYQKDLENLKATCERGFAEMEETHLKVIEEIQRQHQREVAHLREERERLLAEETAATISALESMKNAHRKELEKTQRSQLNGANADVQALTQQYREELQSVQRELEVLSEQYSQKCLENVHLAQALESERQALSQCQRENQELSVHIQELNERLTVEITRMRSCLSGEGSPAQAQGKDLYELEVLLRVKDSEIQYLKQEVHSLKDELQSVLKDKKYVSDKYKDIYTELSVVKAKADCDVSKLKQQLRVAAEALGERVAEAPPTAPAYDILKSKSSPDFLKKEYSGFSRQIGGVRSKGSDVERVSLDS